MIHKTAEISKGEPCFDLISNRLVCVAVDDDSNKLLSNHASFPIRRVT